MNDAGSQAHPSSTLYREFDDLGMDTPNGSVHAKLILASARLTGNGAAPVELLAKNRRAIFTYPDIPRNGYARASLHPHWSLSDAPRIDRSFYAQLLVRLVQLIAE